mgnify:FL=1|jgi:hypothetical protein|tara:strand:- start:90 stop:323 length:234 start_codon:yes stop_codon:yes gene_type:complete
MVKTYIHVNQHKIKANLKNKTNEPVITVKKGKTNTYCHAVEIQGNSIVRYGGNEKPILPCGARVVIETQDEVKILDK